MTSPFIPKSSFTAYFATLIMALQLTACGTEDLLSAISPDIGSGVGTESIIETIDRSAKISGTDTGSVIEDVDPDGDNLLEVSGKLIIADNNTEEESFVTMSINGTYGNLNIDTTGNWDYFADNNQSSIQNLNANETLTDILTVSSTDGTTHTITITIIGVIDSGSKPNNPAVITGVNTGSVTEDNDPDNDNLLEISGKLNITDSDPGEAAFISTTINGNYGSLNIGSTGNWNYSANNSQNAIQSLNTGASLNESLTISSLDGTTQLVVITISGVNEANIPAVITGTANGSVTEDVDPDNDNLLETAGKLNITDSNPGEASFVAKTVNGNYGSLTINATGNWTYAANNSQTVIQNLATGASLNDSLTVNSVDGTTKAIIVTINGVTDISSNISLSWVAPAQRANNSVMLLSEIASYKIYYGTTQAQYTNSVTINDGSAIDYTFMNFNSGKYYFVITTIDSKGAESTYSTEVSIVI